MPSTTDNEYASLLSSYGPGSMQDMRMKQQGGPTTPGKSVTDLEYSYFASNGGSANSSRSDNEGKYWQGNNSLSDDKNTAGSVLARTLTNICTNPTPGSVTNWKVSSANYFTLSYSANEILCTILPAIDVNWLCNWEKVGGINYLGTVTKVGVMYQYSLEIWTDLANVSCADGGSGSHVPTTTLTQNQWTKLDWSVVGNGSDTKEFLFYVIIPSGIAPTGVHSKYRRAMMVESPTPVSYFDGSTPDEFLMDFAWTGTPNASTSTATSKTVPAGGYTNLALNPTPTSIAGWASNDIAQWTFAYAAGEVSITVTAALQVPGQAANMVQLGNFPQNPVLVAGMNYQRSFEIWVDANATIASTYPPGFVPGQALPAGQWTRVVQQFIASGAADYVLNHIINIPGVVPGMHVKYRRAQVIENPSGLEQPYFDGSTPDTATMDFEWTGAANNSTSTAKRK
jgi:hypothetical protein